MRLLPALAVMLTFVALAGFLFDPAGAVRISGLTGIFASFFSANFYLYSLPNGYFDVSGQLDPLLHTWTLAVEEQFYVLFPVTLLGAWLIGLRARGPRAARLTARGGRRRYLDRLACAGTGVGGRPSRRRPQRARPLRLLRLAGTRVGVRRRVASSRCSGRSGAACRCSSARRSVRSGSG